MANKSENAEIAVLQTQMSDVQATVLRIEGKLDNQNVNYVTKNEFDAFKKNWLLSHIVTALITAVITAAAYYIIAGHLK